MTQAECGATVNLYGYSFDVNTNLNCLSDEEDFHWHDEEDAIDSGCGDSEVGAEICCHHQPLSSRNFKDIDGYLE